MLLFVWELKDKVAIKGYFWSEKLLSLILVYVFWILLFTVAKCNTLHNVHLTCLQVRIWNMKCVGRDLEADESTPKLLATLRDHFGSVNCVRWAKHGRYVASGSDDQVILVHERKPGSGTTEFGSGEPPDVENWKVTMTLRGHTADVVI